MRSGNLSVVTGLCLAVVASCNPIANDSEEEVVDVDRDGDGYGELGGDCDDNDPARHPGATEQCDDIDHDCDGKARNDLVVRVQGEYAKYLPDYSRLELFLEDGTARYASDSISYELLLARYICPDDTCSRIIRSVTRDEEDRILLKQLYSWSEEGERTVRHEERWTRGPGRNITIDHDVDADGITDAKTKVTYVTDLHDNVLSEEIVSRPTENNTDSDWRFQLLLEDFVGITDTRWDRTWDAEGRLLSIRLYGSSVDYPEWGLLSRTDYTYDEQGQQTSEVEYRYSVSVYDVFTARTILSTYHENGELKTHHETTHPVLWGYPGDGPDDVYTEDIQHYNDQAGITYSRWIKYNKREGETGIEDESELTYTYTLDEDGKITMRAKRSLLDDAWLEEDDLYSYDDEGRLLQIDTMRTDTGLLHKRRNYEYAGNDTKETVQAVRDGELFVKEITSLNIDGQTTSFWEYEIAPMIVGDYEEVDHTYVVEGYDSTCIGPKSSYEPSR